VDICHHLPNRADFAQQTSHCSLKSALEGLWYNAAPNSTCLRKGAMTDSARPRHPWLAAVLSFILPGLGQAYAGHWLLAALLATPVVVLVATTLTAFVVVGDGLRNELLSSRFLVGALALDVALLGWRLFAISHAAFVPAVPATVASRVRAVSQVPARGAEHRSRGGLALIGVLLLATVAMHSYVAVVVGQLNETLDQVFAGTGAPDPQGGIGTIPGPINEPEYTWDGTDRINFLLLGVDAAPGREAALTDTILVVSVDPVDRTAVMVSIPRDTAFVPLPDTRVFADARYPNKINQLSTEAAADAARWCPDLSDKPETCGLRTLQRSVGLYLGIQIHHFATVDLLGFTKLIDALGGLQLCLPGRLVDPEYTHLGGGGLGLELEAGCHHYDGEGALAYARSRKGWIELPDGTLEYQNDFLRAERQQGVLLGVRRELAQMNMLFELPGLLEAVGQTVVTDFPRAQAGDLSSLVPLITGPDIERVVLGYPEFVDLGPDPETNYILTPRREAIRAEMRRLFGQDEPLEGWYVGSDVEIPDAELPDEAGRAP
jgi:LCP family protein required for cell wall assembly